MTSTLTLCDVVKFDSTCVVEIHPVHRILWVEIGDVC